MMIKSAIFKTLQKHETYTLNAYIINQRKENSKKNKVRA